MEELEQTQNNKVPLSEWLTCFCVVKFDIEIGQTLEYTYPPTMKFTDEETTNICFMAFPDSNSTTGDTLYSFRTRVSPLGESNSSNKSNNDNDNDDFLHGYVFFRQVKDASIARGYLQKSVVLLSVHPYVGLFKKVMSVVGPVFFESLASPLPPPSEPSQGAQGAQGPQGAQGLQGAQGSQGAQGAGDGGLLLLEAAYHNMALWPRPVAGKTAELPILGSTLTYHVPFAANTPHIIDPSTRVLAFTPREQVVSNLQSVNIYQVFKALDHKLWLLWELVLTGSPLLIVSPSPTQCSDAVIGLVSLISPLRYMGDYRPYFTIHDSDFKKFSTTKQEEGNCPLMLGVTNPFFLKALAGWPHVLTVGQPPAAPRHATPPKIPGLQRDRVSKHVTDYKQGIQTSHKPLIEPDSKILKQLISSSSSASPSPAATTGQAGLVSLAVNNELLRRHFLRLTESFLVPLERYFSSLMPLARSISLFHRPPRLKPFNKAEFLDIIASIDKPYIIHNKSKELELYKRFLASVNFQGWFNERKQAALQQLNLIYHKLIFDADITTLLKGRSNVETVDLYMRLREQLIIEEGRVVTEESVNVANKLRQHLQIVSLALPNISPSTLSPTPSSNTNIPIVTK